jgi:protein-tyrosine-phosphatase
VRVVLVCLANTCRSPAAAALLARSTGASVEILARGLQDGPDVLPAALERALADVDLEVARPVGVALAREEARAADLCLFMERRLLREVVVVDRRIWPACFTVREFARRALDQPPGDEETFAQWRAILHAGRTSEELLGADERDDVADPGLDARVEAYATMIATLADVTARVAPFLTNWPATSAS